MIINNGNDLEFFIQFDILEKVDRFTYGIFNFILNEKLYPAKGTNWTLNLIAEYMSAFLDYSDDDFFYLESDFFDAKTLFREAVISRLGYFYDDPDNILDKEEMIKKYPKKIGVELELSELNDAEIDIYFFKSICNEYMVFSYKEEIYKITVNINDIKEMIRSFYNCIKENNAYGDTNRSFD